MLVFYLRQNNLFLVLVVAQVAEQVTSVSLDKIKNAVDVFLVQVQSELKVVDG